MSAIQIRGAASVQSSESIRSDYDFSCSFDAQPTGYGDSSMDISLKPPEDVKIPEPSSQNYSDSCCYRSCKPKAGYYKEATAIREYRKKLQKEYDAIFEQMNWVELPGHEDEKVKGQNYLTSQFWMYSYAAVKIDDEEATDTFVIAKHFEAAMVAVEEVGMTLRFYLKPLEKITEACSFLETMSNLINARMRVPGVDSINIQSGEVMERAVLRGNMINDFSKLQVYSRDPKKIQWSGFKTIGFGSQLSHLTKGLDQFIESVRAVRMLLEYPLETLKNAGFKIFSRGTTLINHMKRMCRYSKRIFQYEQVDVGGRDEEILKQLFLETNTHVLYILQTGRNLVTKVWEIVLMTRLSYLYVSANTHAGLTEYDELMRQRFQKNPKLLLKPSSYDSEDFFQAPYPDFLRKVPIIVRSSKLELALHYEGHRNTVTTPGNKSPTSGYVRRKSQSTITNLENNPFAQKNNAMRENHASLRKTRRKSSTK